MSLLSDFSEGAFNVAKDIIGTKNFSINSGPMIEAVKGEARYDRASELNGFQAGETLTIVVNASKFVCQYSLAARSYLGQFCTFDGEKWRVGDIEKGEVFVTITLISRSEVS